MLLRRSIGSLVKSSPPLRSPASSSLTPFLLPPLRPFRTLLPLQGHAQQPYKAEQARFMSTSSSFAPPSPPLGSPLDPQVYSAGREKALQLAKEQGFPAGAVIELPVQWGDMDSNAHVNNVVYFRWLESGRLAYVHNLTRTLPDEVARDLRGSGKGKGLILARITFDYRLPTFYPDSVLVMHKPVEFTSRKMVLETAVYSYAQQSLVGRGEAIMVSYDYNAQKSVVWPEEVLKQLEEAGARRVEKGAGGAGGKAKL